LGSIQYSWELANRLVRLTRSSVTGYSAAVTSPSRAVLFTLSKGLTQRQGWAVDSFPAIMRRATGGNEQWALTEQARDEETGDSSWRYQVEAIPDIDLIVDHIIHELTDAVLLSEWHSTSEDRFVFGSLRRDRPPQPSSSEETQLPHAEETAT
jgi:hypothetical protein